MRSLRLYWDLLHKYIRDQAARVALLGLLIVGSTALELLQPRVLGKFVDSATSGAAAASLSIYGLIFIGVALAAKASAAWARYMGEDIGWAATNRLREDLTTHCLGLSMAFHKSRTPGEMIERIDGDASLLSNYFSKFAVSIAGAALLLSGALLLLLRESSLVGLSMMAYTIATTALVMYLRSVSTRRSLRVRSSTDQLYGFVGEVLESREDLRANGAVEYVMRRAHALAENWMKLRRWAGVAQYSMGVSGDLMQVLRDMLVLGLVAYQWLQHRITLGTAFVFYQYMQLIHGQMQILMWELRDLERTGAGIERIQRLLAERPTVVGGDRMLLGTGALAVSLDDVSFEYEAGNSVLKHISLEIAPGRIIGVLGRTGSGKTTLANLIGRLYDTTSGEIRLGGQEIRSLDSDSLGKRVAVVTQDVQLFQGTVRDNVSIFDPSLDDDSILRAIDAAGLTPWLATQPNGLSTGLQGSGGLSAGQAQLLAFARVMLQDPGLVILDEASSRLDLVTENLLGRAIKTLLTGRTGLIIAHRLSTVEMADDIMILDNGQVVEYGERLALVRDPSSRFSRLLQSGSEALLA